VDRPASKVERGAALGGLDSAARGPVSPVGELRLLRAVDELEARLRDVGDAQKAARLAARDAAALMGAGDSCVALLSPGESEAVLLPGVQASPRPWDRRMLAEFARRQKTEAPAGVALARLKRRDRPWGTLALRWEGAEPDWDTRHALTKMAEAANQAIERIERQRLGEVRSRIDRKIMEQLRPKDLFYQLLDGLRTLTAYDHCGLLLTSPGERCVLEVAAEQVAWRKAKSDRIGRTSLVPAEAWAGLCAGKVWGFSRDGAGWTPWDPSTPSPVTGWVAGALAAEGGAPSEAELICAPLCAAGEVAAVLRISALHPGTFGVYEIGLVEALLPQAMVALQNARRAETLTGKVLEAERKHAMAELARGVSHDINNAMGSILPLVQQLRDDAARGQVAPATLDTDLAQIERSVLVCTRIFNGMLRMARRSADGSEGRARVPAAVDAALGILAESCRRHRIEVARDTPAELPEVPLAQGELEQVLLNLIGNARDAMATMDGGELTVRAAPAQGPSGEALVRLEVADTGVGIPSQSLTLVFEPFFTTKPAGNGLGLAVCRSIVWQAHGRIHAESPARTGVYPSGGPGSRFVVSLPAAGN
jgi:two-component system NtrC family sensor kinase